MDFELGGCGVLEARLEGMEMAGVGSVGRGDGGEVGSGLSGDDVEAIEILEVLLILAIWSHGPMTSAAVVVGKTISAETPVEDDGITE